jgi:hypothetical protein
VRRTIALWGPPEWIQLIGVFGAVVLGVGLVSPARTAVLTLFGVMLTLGLVFWLPSHLFLGASVAVLASSTAPAFEGHPTSVGSIKIYTFDLLLALVLVRAALPRERRPQELRILDAAVVLPVALWGLFMLIAGTRGFLAGNSVGAIARLETPLVYFPLFVWGFTRVLGEISVSVPRVLRALAITSLCFVGYAAYARITHQRFGTPSGSGIGPVETSSAGVLRRDYGFFSAFQLYALLALGGLAYLVFSRRATLGAIIVTSAGLAATILTLVRGLIFGVVAGAIWLIVLSVKTRWHVKLGSRLLPLVVLLALAGTLFAIFSPATARGVSQRFLPGVLAQTQSATDNTEHRIQILKAGEKIARDDPFGLGFVAPDAVEAAGYRPIDVADSQWASVLVYTGWPGVFLLVWAGFAVVRRSFQLPAAAPWLHPLVAAVGLFLLIQGFAWNIFFSQTWSIGMLALILALRFGLRTTAGRDSPEPSF